MDEVAIPLRVVPDGTEDKILERMTAVDGVLAAALDEELVLRAAVEDADALSRPQVLLHLEAAQPRRRA